MARNIFIKDSLSLLILNFLYSLIESILCLVIFALFWEFKRDNLPSNFLALFEKMDFLLEGDDDCIVMFGENWLMFPSSYLPCFKRGVSLSATDLSRLSTASTSIFFGF